MLSFMHHISSRLLSTRVERRSKGVSKCLRRDQSGAVSITASSLTAYWLAGFPRLWRPASSTKQSQSHLHYPSSSKTLSLKLPLEFLPLTDSTGYPPIQHIETLAHDDFPDPAMSLRMKRAPKGREQGLGGHGGFTTFCLRRLKFCLAGLIPSPDTSWTLL